MHLPDAGRRDWAPGPSGGTAAPARRPARSSRPRPRAPGAIGGASAWSVASARCASSRQPLEDEAEQLPDLHHRPLHLPQLAGRVLGRADDEAGVELGSRSSEAPTWRTRCAVQSAPRRALSRHMRAERAMRARRSGSRRAVAVATPAAAAPMAIRAGSPRGSSGLRRAGRVEPASDGIGGQQVVRERLAGDLARPVRAGVEPVERHLDAGQVLVSGPGRAGLRARSRLDVRPGLRGAVAARSTSPASVGHAPRGDPCPLAGGQRFAPA